MDSELSDRVRAKRRGQAIERAMRLASQLIGIGGFLWFLFGQRSDWAPAVVMILLGVLLYWSAYENGRARGTLTQRRWWEEIEDRGAIWGWGRREPGKVLGPYCKAHSRPLQECGTAREDDAVIVSPAAPLCCSADPSERFTMEVGSGEEITLGELRAQVRYLLLDTEG